MNLSDGNGKRAVISVLLIITVFLSGCTTQQPDKIYNVGVLCSIQELAPIFDSFREKMTELGYIEGENIFYDLHVASLPIGNEDIIQGFVDDDVDLIFSFATEAAIEAKAVTEGSGIPVVFTCTFIEGTDVVDSISTPGGNITGVRYPTTESAAGRLEILSEIAPDATKVWIPYLRTYPTVSSQIELLRVLASELNITLIESAFDAPEEVKEYLDGCNVSDDLCMDAILMMAEPFSITPEVFIEVYDFADEHALPVISFMVFDDAYGPIIGFHPSNEKMGSLAAVQADKILKGAQAGTLPVFTSENDLSINYKLAQELGLTVSEGLLARANRIVR